MRQRPRVPTFLSPSHTRYANDKDTSVDNKTLSVPPSGLLLIPRALVLRLSETLTAYLDVRAGLERQIDDLVRNPESLLIAEHETIYHHLLAPPKLEDRPSRKSLADEAFTLIAAGTETSSNACTVGTFYFLSNRAIRTKILLELEEAWPDKDRPTSFMVLEKLPYLTAFIRETLRFAPGAIHPLPRLTSRASATVIGSWEVPPGTIVEMGVLSMHLNPDIFPDPQTFKPERWLAAADEDLGRMLENLSPFSRGPRICIGLNLAWCELYLIFANIFRKLDLALLVTEDTIEDYSKDYVDAFVASWGKGYRVFVDKIKVALNDDLRTTISTLIVLIASAVVVKAASTVELDYGTFIGVQDTTTGITSFKGVRFAEPPVGDLRWKAPVFPPKTQLGTVDASSFGNSCIPVPQSTVVPGTSEDCLFANVYVPINATSHSKLPVMIWFHGGGFQTGNSQNNAVPLMQAASSGMIFVAFEYRLGQFGFLAGTSYVDAGDALNAGLLDQRAGLKWVQRYISDFGGDPEKVTIWGESAGAASTLFHLIANGGDREGLFRASMGDSTPLTFMPSCDSAYLNGIFDAFVGFAGCSSSLDAMSCLAKADAEVLASAGTELLGNRTSTLFVFDPCLDGVFLATRPVEAFKSGKFSKVPVLVGSNTNEGAHWSADLPNPAANTSEPDATETTVFNFLAGQWPGLTDDSFARALELYPLEDYNNSFSLQGQQMYGEARYICSGALIASAMTEEGLTAFHYHYDNPDLGSDHGSELTGLFDLASEFTGNDAALFLSMQQFWASFVITQEPRSEAMAWTAVTNITSGALRILLHPGEITMEDIPDAQTERCAFWHSISEEMST
ncbi:hypothetical protein D9757_009716 [Collybiopsis confluens]|uniref:Carboxylesterase type B domain-containing protein n=1 Tax=Collybiopsis confluens TaxID=2823264 RepID=A0A8H5H666_9AGAR|nr:hypothetical protein D9757_009716 [Collybiopsis confluens]